MIRASAIKHAIIAAAVFLMVAPAVQAVVSTIDATVSAKVEEYVGTELTNSDEAFEDLDNSTSNLPLVADVGFLHIGPNGENAGASAATTFNDPRLSQTPDPDEFGIDVTAYSEEADLWYAGLCNSTEMREITFSKDEIGEPDGTEIQARSYFYVDGLIMLWGQLNQTDLSETVAEFWLTVQQLRPNATEEVTVLQASLKITGQPDGTVVMTTSGSLVPDNVTILDLSDLVTEMGRMHVVILPNVAIPYTYSTKIGEQFSLKAEIEGKVSTRPGTGAGVSLGVPLLELIDLITNVAGSDAGTVFEDTLLNALNFSPPPLKPLLATGEETEITVVGKDLNSFLSLPVCGLMGSESAILLVTFLVLTIAPLRRKN